MSASSDDLDEVINVPLRHFLTVTDFSRAELDRTLDLAAAMKLKRHDYHSFGGGSAALIFKKPSLRTRVSFDVGVFELGGHPLYITDQEIGLGQRESVHDIAQVLSRFVSLIQIRTFAHAEVEELAACATVPVINGLTDSFHPCQIVADLLTVREHKGKLDGLVITYLGDGNNVAHSWLTAAERYAFELRIGTVAENDPDPEVLRRAQAAAKGRVVVVRDPEQAVAGSDVLYTDVWASMGQKEKAAENRKRLWGFQINSRLLGLARPDAIVLHCLPAVRGEEITDDVMDGPQCKAFEEAENRLHAQKSIMHMLLVELAGASAKSR
jgi:ornithine carbamoyltransferase